MRKTRIELMVVGKVEQENEKRFINIVILCIQVDCLMKILYFIFEIGSVLQIHSWFQFAMSRNSAVPNVFLKTKYRTNPDI